MGIFVDGHRGFAKSLEVFGLRFVHGTQPPTPRRIHRLISTKREHFIAISCILGCLAGGIFKESTKLDIRINSKTARSISYSSMSNYQSLFSVCSMPSNAP
jgi:hypothetical protein